MVIKHDLTGPGYPALSTGSVGKFLQTDLGTILETGHGHERPGIAPGLLGLLLRE